MRFKDDLNNIVNPEVLDYKYFLKDQTKMALLSLAKLANLRAEPSIKKEELIDFLSVEIPKALPRLIDKLDSRDRLKCEIIVSSGGCISAWELRTRMKLESRLKKSLAASFTTNRGDPDRRLMTIKKYRSYNVDYEEKDKEDEDEDEEYLEDMEEAEEDYDYFPEHRFPFYSHESYSYYQPYEQERIPLSAILAFPKPLLYDSDNISKVNERISHSREVYLLIPKEARGYFKARSLKVDLVESSENEEDLAKCSSLEAPDLLNLMQTLLDNISSKRPKPTPKAGLIPKATILPIFKQLVARSQVYKKLHEAKYFGWNDFNELLMGFMYDKRLVRRSIRREGEAERLEVVSSKASEILSSSKILNESFLEWWANGKTSSSSSSISHFLFESKIFEFDSKMPKLKSDEIATRKLLHMQIKNEMKPGTWYFTHSILGKCSIESGGNLFKDRMGYSLSAYGPKGVLSNHDEVLEEFLSMMLVFPLCLLGILQTNSSKKELMMLGRGAHPPVSVEARLGYPSDVKYANLVTITSNFEIVLQSRPPEGRTLAFHLREFCDPLTKSSHSGGGSVIIDEPVLVFKLSKHSVLRGLRTGNYTLQTIFSLLTRAAGSADNIPQNVMHELKDWGERYGEVEITTAEVLKCKDEVIAESLMKDPTLRKHITSRIGNTTIEIKPGSRYKIRSRCDKLGYFTK